MRLRKKKEFVARDLTFDYRPERKSLAEKQPVWGQLDEEDWGRKKEVTE